MLGLEVMRFVLGLLLGCHVTISFCDPVSNSMIKFLDHLYSYQDWLSLQSYLDDAFSNGEFVSAWDDPDFVPMFWRPCVYEDNQIYLRWVFGTCYDSEYNRGNIYQWRTHNSLVKYQDIHHLQRWSPQKMCKIMNGSNIAFVGDSMAQQTQLTFASAMMRDLFVPEDKINDDNYVNNKRRKVSDYCDNYCPWRQHGSCHMIEYDCGSLPSFKSYVITSKHLEPSEWVNNFDLNDVSIVLFNSGPHFLPTEERVGNIDKSLAILVEKFPKTSFIFRTTPPGHPRCDSLFHSSPIEGRLYNYSDDTEKPYHYGDFISQSLAVIDMLAKKYPQVLILNVHNATSNRVDSHPLVGDCLHYCIPGPLTTWIEFLFHALATCQSHAHQNNTIIFPYRSFAEENSINTDIIEPLFFPFKEQEGTIMKPVTASRRYMVDIGETSYYLWANNSRHRMTLNDIYLANISLSDIKKINNWEFIAYPQGRPISPF